MEITPGYEVQHSSVKPIREGMEKINGMVLGERVRHTLVAWLGAKYDDDEGLLKADLYFRASMRLNEDEKVEFFKATNELEKIN